MLATKRNWPCHKEGYADLPPPLKSGYPCIKYAQCAETNEKWYIRFFQSLVFELFIGCQRCYHSATKKNCIVQKWSNLQGKCGLNWQLFFCSWVLFCATLSFWDIVDFINDSVHNFQVFLPTIYGQK